MAQKHAPPNILNKHSSFTEKNDSINLNQMIKKVNCETMKSSAIDSTMANDGGNDIVLETALQCRSNSNPTNPTQFSKGFSIAETLEVLLGDEEVTHHHDDTSPAASDFQLSGNDKKDEVIETRLKQLSFKNKKNLLGDIIGSSSNGSNTAMPANQNVAVGFDLSRFRKADEAKKAKQTNAEEDINLEPYKKLLESLASMDTADIYRYYQNFEKTVPKHLHIVPVSETLSTPCCKNLCCFKFNTECVMTARLTLPVISTTKANTSYNVIQQFHFFLIKNNYINGLFSPKVNNIPICSEFFCRIYIVNDHRFKTLCDEVLRGNVLPSPHGNIERKHERTTTLERFAQLVFSLNHVVEPHPSGTGLMGPPGWTKKEVIDQASFITNFAINPTQEMGRLGVNIAFRKQNALTKCDTCDTLRQIRDNPKAPPEKREEAKMHLKTHKNNIINDNRDKYVRMAFSLEGDDLLSIGHDGMAKHKTKLPHLLKDNTKKLPDKLKMMCSLNLAVVHKKKDNLNYQNHCYWNVDQLSGGDSNVVVSQLLHAISMCDKIPNQIAIQLDNCQSNKSYTLIGAFGLLLHWVPKLVKIYVCYSEVGHTHNDIDQKFGVLAKALAHDQVYSPQGLAKYTEKHLKGVVSNNLFPTTYDFDSIVKAINDPCGKIKENHMFQLSRDENDDVILKIARFMRSETFLVNDPKAENPNAFSLFESKPDPEIFPAIVPRKEFDLKKHLELVNSISGKIPLEGWQELEKLPEVMKNLPPPENFETLLKRIASKVVEPPAKTENSDDPNNEKIKKFINSGLIEKLWAPTSTAEQHDNEADEEPAVAPPKTKNKRTNSAKRKKLDEQPTDEASTTETTKKLQKARVVKAKAIPKGVKRSQPS